MTKPRILVVNMMVPAGDGDDPQYTGEWRGTYGMSIALARAGADVTLLSPAIGKHETRVRREIDPVARAAGVNLRYANFVLNRRIPSYMTLRLSLAWLREYIRLRPDLVIFKQARPDIALLLPGLTRKSLVLANDVRTNDTPTTPASSSPSPTEDSSLVYRPPTRREALLNKLSHWLIWSIAKLRPLPRQYNWKMILTGSAAHETIPTEHATPTEPQVLWARKGMLIYGKDVWKAYDHFDPVDVIFCGVIGLRKGIFELLEAWRQMPPDAQLAIVGTGPPEMLARLEQEIADMPNVQHWGSLGFFEKFALFNKAKLLVLPSHRDFRPVVIYEAFTVGLPVITTHQIISQVRHGETGLLVNAGDVDALVRAINDLLTHEPKRQRMAENARKTSADYTWDDVVDQVLTLAANT